MAESPEMAGPDPTLAALFRVPGVAEAILEAGRVWVRPGRLFSWEDVEASVRWALKSVYRERPFLASTRSRAALPGSAAHPYHRGREPHRPQAAMMT